MSQVYNPESDIAAESEMRQKIEHVENTEDRGAMNRLLNELRDRLAYLERKVS